ncbi:Electron transport complex protein RnfG, partial [Dysosmobacter welbionis]
AYARAKATKSGVCRPKPVTPLRHCRTLVKRRPRPAGALYVSGERIGFIVCDEKFLRLLLRIDQPGLEPAQGFLRIGDGVEEQQIFLGDLLHLVFILSKPPQDLGTALIIHKGRAKFCLNLSRYPRFCKKFKNQHKIAGISEKTKKIQGLLPEKMEMAKKSGPRQARTAPEFKSGFGLLQL